ncbi:MAG: hypothetical protein J3K34DRAFT_472571 [Monoraphidium minutum]|nr:MAG: hypothetical protein J3K34DRAFT_472571 [Monoraphidium minutum]
MAKIMFAVVAALLLAGAQAAMNTDRTLTTAGAACMDRFTSLMKEQYKGDTKCPDLIKAAMSTSDPAKCPAGSQGEHSQVQECMAKNDATAKAWSGFIRTCEVLNVANRAGEAEAATERKPSCFPPFTSVDDFTKWVQPHDHHDDHDDHDDHGDKAASAAAAPAAAAWALLAAVGAAAVAAF